MTMTLRELLAHSKKQYGIKIIAGTLGLNRPCRWVHIVEDDDVPSFLHGNELIFTTGIGMSSKPDFSLMKFAHTLIGKKSSGWVLNIGPYIKEVPQEVIDFCNSKGLPLFVVPWDKRLVDVTYDLSHILVENEKFEISVSKAFSNAIFSLGDEEKNYSILSRGGFNPSTLLKIMIIEILNPEVVESFNDLIVDIESEFQEFTISVFSESNSLVVISNESIHLDGIDKNKIISNCLERNGINYRIGISNIAEGYKNLSVLYSEASDALKTAELLESQSIYYSECGIYKLLYKITDNAVRDNYLAESIGNIIKYDSENNTNYLEVLETYIKMNGNINEIAEFYGVHRNTVNYRIRFIKDNFGLNLNYEDIAKLVISFKLMKIIGK